MIDDEELRTLFEAEAGDYLHRLEAGLLRLERGGTDADTLEEVFRQAHSLKGAARMVGVRDVEAATHALEDRLNEARRGRAALTREEISAMLASLDGLRQMVQAAVQVEEPASDAGDVVRVSGSRLDELIEQAGELVVARTRLAVRLREAEDLLAALEHGALAERAERLVDALRDDVFHLHRTVDAVDEGLREARLAPAERLFRGFERMVRELAVTAGKEIELEVLGRDTTADRAVLDELRDPLVHLVRNAVAHGLEEPEERLRAGKPRQGHLVLQASRAGRQLLVDVRDDGRGLDLQALREAALAGGLHTREDLEAMPDEAAARLVFAGGVSTQAEATDLAGRGVGLSVVRERAAQLKGTVEVSSRPGAGVRFRMGVPASVAALHVLLARSAGQVFAIPLDRVVATRWLRAEDLARVAGGDVIPGEFVSMVSLDRLLGLPAAAPREAVPCALVRSPSGTVALAVDELLAEGEVVLKPLAGLLRHVRHVLGASVLPSGDVALVIDAASLAEAAERAGRGDASVRVAEPERPRRVLLVEDSMATRVQLQRILAAAGYQVETAVDGLEALDRLGREPFDAVVSDVEMPRLDGFALTARIRSMPALERLPVVLVTSMASDEDRRQGLEAGADAYLVKQAFRHDELLAALGRLL